jgi:hypothetical protein
MDCGQLNGIMCSMCRGKKNMKIDPSYNDSGLAVMSCDENS